MPSFVLPIEIQTPWHRNPETGWRYQPIPALSISAMSSVKWNKSITPRSGIEPYRWTTQHSDLCNSEMRKTLHGGVLSWLSFLKKMVFDALCQLSSSNILEQMLQLLNLLLTWFLGGLKSTFICSCSYWVWGKINESRGSSSCKRPRRKGGHRKSDLHHTSPPAPIKGNTICAYAFTWGIFASTAVSVTNHTWWHSDPCL